MENPRASQKTLAQTENNNQGNEKSNQELSSLDQKKDETPQATADIEAVTPPVILD